MPGEALVSVRGLPQFPSIKEVNVRSGPGTGHALAFKVPVGMSGLSILNVAPDEAGHQLNGKTYQWFQLRFHGGAVGWVRDDLIWLEGDARAWGYPDLHERTYAFALERQQAAPEPAHGGGHAPVGTRSNVPPAPPAGPAGAVLNFAPAMQDLARVRKTAFAITAAFEGSGYAAYNNYDRGIVSYGFLQFTLAAGALARLLDLYLQQANHDVADKLRGFIDRVRQRDPLLRSDTSFRDALIAAADDPVMQQAQDQVATESYWQRVIDGYITHRGLQTPLAWMLLFDMGVNFGTNHGFVRLAEEQLGVPPRSRPGENGITEQQLIERVAELRKQSHDRQAARDNLPGLRVRGDFWVGLVQQNDWGVQGDAQGIVRPNGRVVRVR